MMSYEVVARGAPSLRDALMGMLDALGSILQGLGVLVKWFAFAIDAGIREGLW
jgi:hypothetical protein